MSTENNKTFEATLKHEVPEGTEEVKIYETRFQATVDDHSQPFPKLNMRYYIVRPTMFVQGKDENQAWQALSIALGCKISKLKYWFNLVETTTDPNASGV